MKARMLFSLALLATLGLTSCKKDKDEDRNTVKIGGKTYPTVTIGDQVWMAENYSGEGGLYYQESDANKTEYGKFYTIEEAKAIAVPAGWRLPTSADIKKLLESQGAEVEENAASNAGETETEAALVKLMATTGWGELQGTNASGFNAFPNGFANDDDEFRLQGQAAIFWTASTYVSDNITSPIFFYLEKDRAMYLSEGPLTGFRMSVRFVKDK